MPPSSPTRRACRAGFVRLTATAALSCLALGGPPAHAWGPLGHRLVAKVADRQLSDQARAAVRGLLDPGESLADASTYADEHKREIDGSAPWHYVNVPIDRDRYDPSFCPPGGCVVSKVKEFRDVVKDRTRSREERLFALRFLVHLVGDLHQPLHVGDDRDKGGNDLQVRFFGKGSNLHRVWDSGLLQKGPEDEAAWLDDLAGLDTEANRRDAMRGTVEDWATESLVAAKAAYTLPGTGRRIRPGQDLRRDYLEANLPVARRRVYRAGVRLARLLNEALAGG